MSGCNCGNPSAKYYGPHNPDCDSLPVGMGRAATDTIEFHGNVQRISHEGRILVPEDDYERLRLELSATRDDRNRDTERHAAVYAERDALRAACERLANEVSGLRAFEHEVRDAISNTNWEVLALREREAREALRGSASDSEVTK